MRQSEIFQSKSFYPNKESHFVVDQRQLAKKEPMVLRKSQKIDYSLKRLHESAFCYFLTTIYFRPYVKSNLYVAIAVILSKKTKVDSLFMNEL